MKPIASVLVAVSALGVLAGCSATSSTPPPTGVSTSIETELPLATSTFEAGPDAAYEGLVVVGDLVRDGECVRLEAEKNSMVPGTLDILWPRGSSAHESASGEITIVGPDGSALAVTGTRVKVTGGSAQVEVSSPCLSPDRPRIELQVVGLSK